VHTSASPQSVRVGASLLDARGHICAFFRSREEEYRVLLPFIKEGFDRGDRAFHIVDPRRRADHARRLSAAGIDVAGAQASGQLDLRDWSEAHLRGGRFDQDRMLLLAQEAIERAHHLGYAHTRFVTHMEWALTDEQALDDLAEYESKANDFVPRDGDPVICVYDLARWGSQVLVDAIQCHPLVVIGGVVHENPFFVAPQEFVRDLRDRAVKAR
jgi:hypothetical protein